MKSLRVASFAAAFIVAAVHPAAPAHAEAPQPATLATAADLHNVLGGTWSVTADEAGSLLGEEAEGFRMVRVEVVAVHPNDMTLDQLVPAYREEGEVVDELTDIGRPAMYRPQYGAATAETTDDNSGERFRLFITVYNIDDVDERKAVAVALLRNAVTRL